MTVFRIIGETAPTVVIPGRHTRANNLMVVKDGMMSELRYCPNEPSIWAKEQNKKSRSLNPVFRNGELRVDENQNPTLIAFLKASPYYGKLYKEVDVAAEARAKNSVKERKIYAGTLVREADEKTIRELAKAMYPVLADQNPELDILKDRFYDAIEVNPEPIIASLDTKKGKEEMSLEAVINEAIQKEVIEEHENKQSILWSDTKAEICTKHHAKGVAKALNEFLSLPENVVVLNQIKARLGD